MDELNFPFKVDQIVESRSFSRGYRGAWFWCQIKELSYKNGELGNVLAYLDYPDQKLKWSKLYHRRSKMADPPLMIRPCYPDVYHESDMSNIDSISKEIVLVNDAWMVGDLVDWLADGCYWSGQLTEVLMPEMFRFQLFPPPAGEGDFYEASSKDFRPSLDWSPEHGWTVPENEGYRSCARIVKPASLAINLKTCEERKRKDCGDSATSDISVGHSQVPEKSVKRLSRTTDIRDTETQPVKNTDASVDTPPVESTTVGTNARPVDSNTNRIKALNSMSSDTIEAVIVDLEELVSQIQWMKNILIFGLPLPDHAQPSWDFIENREQSTKI